MIDYEQGRQHLDRLVQQHAQSIRERNEAATRFAILDEIILHVLGWTKDQTDIERHKGSKFTDYELGRPAQVVVEAKREDAQFDVPSGFSNTPTLKDLREQSPELCAVIDQALGYCQQRGIAIAAVSNGHQVAAFLASRQDGVAPIDGRALLFHSLSDMRERFRELWDALSPPGVRAQVLQNRLRAKAAVPPPAKLSASIHNYPGFKNRNPVAANLQILGGLFIEDVAKEPSLEEAFLRATYCTSGALSQYALVSKELLAARYAHTFETTSNVSAAPVATQKGVNPALTQDMLAAALSRRPILLVGDVGAGKTMFIRHFRTVEARSELQSAMVMYVDFGSKPALATELKSYVAKELRRQLLDDHQIDIEERGFVRGTYHSQVARFAKGIYGGLKDTDPAEYAKQERALLERNLADEDGHLRSSLEHVSKGRRKQIVVFLDNVDQRPLPFQEEVFLIAQSMAEHWPVTVFVSLRPETFAQSRVSGALSAYQPRVFTIEPPRVDRVLAARLAFAIDTLENTGSLSTLPSNVSLKADSLLAYLRVIQRALEAGGDIVEFLDNMSAGNVRKALDYVQTFIGSGHVDSRKILEVEESGRSYTLPLHEFLRAVMFGDKAYYDPASSPIPNALDISACDGREHFLVALLIRYSETLGSSAGKDGYVERTRLFEHLQQFGFQHQQLERALEVSLKALLVATPSGGDGDRVRVTTRGAYVIKRLLLSFSYLDAVLVDTPIVDPGVRSTIADVSMIDDRIARCERFVDYLDCQWEALGSLETLPAFSWPQVSEALRQDLRRVSASAQRRRSSD